MNLPALSTPEAYQAAFERAPGVAEAVEAIAARHGLAGVQAERFPQGTNFVYALGPAHVLKLFAPLYAADFAIERDALSLIGPTLTVPYPELLAEGELDGWPYMLLRRLAGRPAVALWGTLPQADRVAIATGLGAWIRSLHRVSPPTTGPLAHDWDTFVSRQLESAVTRHTADDLAPGWLDGLPAFLEAHRATLTAPSPRVLLQADLTDGNVLLAQEKGRWRVSGVLDFAVAMTGAPPYEFIAPAWCFARGDAQIVRALHEGAGLPPASPETLLAWILIHRFARLAPMTRRAPGLEPGDFEALAHALYGAPST